MDDPIRVLIADHSAFVRRALERMLSSEPAFEVVGEAATAEESIALARRLRPDVVILDVAMPDMDGMEALHAIMAEAPTGVLMLSTPSRDGAGATLSALEAGAVDFLDRTGVATEMDIYDLAPQLREKVIAVAGAVVREPSGGASGSGLVTHLPSMRVRTRPVERPFDVVVIGASTGGPRALAEVLTQLPADFPAGVVIAQHMPPGFTRTLADRLDRRCALEVREAGDGEPIAPGTVLVGAGGAHITVQRRGKRLRVRVDDGPTELIHRPSIDRLFHSAAEACGSRAIGVVLTGMGDDGSRGLGALREAGSYTIAESESTAVIFGMPRAAAAAAERVLPLAEIGPCLTALCAPGLR